MNVGTKRCFYDIAIQNVSLFLKYAFYMVEGFFVYATAN